MSTDHGESMARRDRRRRVQGYGLEIREMPQNATLPFANFQGGLHLEDEAFSIPENASGDALDVDVVEGGGIEPMAGITTQELLSGHDPREFFAHPNLNGIVELVIVDPPDIGVKVGSNPTVWHSTGLPGGHAWNAAVHGEQLLLTNGSQDVFYRNPGQAGVSPTNWEPGVAVASWAGRTWKLGGQIGGILNPYGIAWGAASGIVTDPFGLGSGQELLLNDTNEGDKGVALQPMGFDMMAILMRKSIWVARRTGDPYRPGDFSPLISGVGAVSAPTVQAVHNGMVVFLSDSGVELFDGNGVTHLSTPIDEELLPLNYAQISKYGAVYSPLRMEYVLFTPMGSYAFSFKYQRWLKSSATPNRAVALFNPAIMDISEDPAGWGLFWGGAWGTNVSTSNIVISDLVYLKDAQLGLTDATARAYFGTAQTPRWSSKLFSVGSLDALFTTKRIELHHGGQAGVVEVWLPDDDGQYTRLMGQITMDATRRMQKLDGMFTGAAAGAQLKFVSGAPQVRRFQLVGEARSRLARL